MAALADDPGGRSAGRGVASRGHHVAAAVQQLYPTTGIEALAKGFEGLLGDVPLWQLLLVIAWPRRCARSWPSAASSSRASATWGTSGGRSSTRALFFGLAHAILQQSLIAVLVGVVIGYIAVQTGSILPCMVFHVVHNSLMLSLSRLTPEMRRTTGRCWAC